tara:strand:- start:12530 stop:12649 length:120 start_codon:yes stop_codon:yes gene_type:complete
MPPESVTGAALTRALVAAGNAYRTCQRKHRALVEAVEGD